MPTITADDGCPLHYRLDGEPDRPVVMLSNSLGTTFDMWQPQMAALLRQHRVLRYDSRGHGGSGVPAGPYSIERLGRDALALMGGLGLERVAWCGLSKGGMVGMWLAIHAPQRLSRAVLANTAARFESPELWNQRIAAVEAGGMAAVAEGVIARWFTADFAAADPAAVDAIRRLLLSVPPAGYAACCAAIRDMDLLAALETVTVPVLVITGDADPATPPELGRQIAERIPGARLMSLPAAHLSNVERPDAFTAAVVDFLGDAS